MQLTCPDTHYELLDAGYMMLRPIERDLLPRRDNRNTTLMKTNLVDEAHHRGAGGAEVAMLIRRLRADSICHENDSGAS